MLRAAVRSAVFAAVGLAVVVRAGADADVRALWVVRTTLVSPAAIEKMVASARDGGFNTLLVQVRGRGDAYFNGGLDPRATRLVDRDFDPLETTIARAHAAGLRVHAWVNVNLVSAASELPSARDHVVYRHPEWLMVPRGIAEDLAPVDPRSPEYLGRLARYIRSRDNEVEGLYVSPVAPGSAAYTTAVVRDIVERYPVDGVHLDYVRYPSDSFDYSRAALEAFRSDVARRITATERKQLDERLKTEPLVYTRAFPERWREFRVTGLTALVAQIRSAIRDARPDTPVSAAVVPDPTEAATHRLQDWRRWIDANYVDVVCPMAYTTNPELFAAQIATARDAAGSGRVWAGIGAYRLNSSQIVDNVTAARRLGVRGIILFSYDSLTGPDRGTDYLTQVGRAAFSP